MTQETTQYLDEAATARLLGVSRRTLQRWRCSGDGPAYIRLGARRLAYDAELIRRWAEAHTYAHRAEEITTTAQ